MMMICISFLSSLSIVVSSAHFPRRFPHSGHCGSEIGVGVHEALCCRGSSPRCFGSTSGGRWARRCRASGKDSSSAGNNLVGRRGNQNLLSYTTVLHSSCSIFETLWPVLLPVIFLPLLLPLDKNTLAPFSRCGCDVKMWFYTLSVHRNFDVLIFSAHLSSFTTIYACVCVWMDVSKCRPFLYVFEGILEIEMVQGKVYSLDPLQWKQCPIHADRSLV